MKTLKNLLALFLIVAMMVPLVTPAFASTYPPYTGNSTSLVDGLNSIGVDSSYSNRERIAFANGITDYCGSASQNSYLASLLRNGNLQNPDSTFYENSPITESISINTYYPPYTGSSSSLVDGLNGIGVDSSYSNREKIALANGITDYCGSASQNSYLASLLRNGNLQNPDCGVNSTPVEEPVMEESYDLPPAEESQFEEVQHSEPTTKVPEIVAVENNEVETYYFSETTNSDASESEIGDYFPAYSGPSQSFADALGELSIDSSFNYRKSIAFVNNIPEYTGAASENITLFSLLKAGRLLKPSTEEPTSEAFSPDVPSNNKSENITVVDKTDDTGTGTEEFVCYNYEDCTADDSKIYIITKDNAPIRTKPSNTGKIISRAKEGQLVAVKRVFPTWKFTRWCELNVPDTDQKYYIYLGNVEEHDDSSHTFINLLTTGKGSVVLCSTCGISKAMLAEKTTVCDLTCVLEQAVLGSFSNQTASFTSVLAQIIVSELPGIGTLADARDIVGDIVNGAPAWVIAADCIGLIPIVGALKFSDEIAVITKNSDELLHASAKSTPDIAKRIENVFNGGYDIKIAGKGSTGRVIPNDLVEKMVMENTLKNPFNPGNGNTVTKIIDSLDKNANWEGWQKWAVSYTVDNFKVGTAEDFAKGENLKNLTRKIEIHFNYDPINNVFDDFKFIN